MYLYVTQQSENSFSHYEIELTSPAFRVNKVGIMEVAIPNLDRDAPNPSVLTFQVRPVYKWLFQKQIVLSFLLSLMISYDLFLQGDRSKSWRSYHVTDCNFDSSYGRER